jgi:Na+/H+ antiporter NhaD/arsenite permease-like protein
VIGIAKYHGQPISFWTFSTFGLIVTAVTVGTGVPYLWLRYFL